MAKQRDLLEELNERREQLEMMIQWKEELSKLKDDVIDRLSQHWSKLVPGYSLNENGLKTLKKLTKQFDLHEILDAMQTAVDQYVTFQQGKPEQQSVERAWGKVSGICRTRRDEETKPYIRELYYIRGILRNRVHVNENYVMELLEEAVRVGTDVESLKTLAKRTRNWTEFREDVESLIQSQREDA
ncbi:MAG TPA: hypothetical protein VH592_13860 [Gemmataceae bacterium]